MHYTPFIVLSAIVLFLYVIPFVVALFGVVRVAVYPIEFSLLDEIFPLSVLEQAATGELAGLGFNPVRAFSIHSGSEDYRGLILREATSSAFALIYFKLRPGITAYPVDFCSFAEDGTAFVTSNRMPQIFEYPECRRTTVFADNLSAHWKAHAERLKQIKTVPLDPDAASQKIAWSVNGALSYSVEKKIFVQWANNWFPSLPTACRVTLDIMRHRNDLRRPYQSVLKTAAYRDAYIAELIKNQNTQADSTKSRADIAFIFLGLSIVLSFGLFSAWLGWVRALAIILVVFFHESGHAVAMRIFGYKDMSMFFIPFAGAVVTGTVKNIPVWKQTIMLLAGPLPGLIAAIVMIFNPAFMANSEFVRMLVYTSLGVNLFNLLPLYFLDGGRLLEIGFFSRWPYAVFAFSALSFFGMAAVIAVLKSYNLFIVLIFLAATLLPLWRAARIRRLWNGNPDSAEDMQRLPALVKKTYGNLSGQRQFQIIKSVCTRPSVNPPRLWETILILCVFLVIWAPVGYGAWFFWDKHVKAQHEQEMREEE